MKKKQIEMMIAEYYTRIDCADNQTISDEFHSLSREVQREITRREGLKEMVFPGTRSVLCYA